MCFTLRLHTSAAPPRVGLTQALGGKKHSAVALSALELIGFGQHCSSGCSSARRFFGQVHRARSHVAYIALAGFGSYVCFRLVLPLQMLSLLTGPADSSRGRAQASGLRFSAGSPQLYPRRHPARLTSRSSRPRVVASAMCFTLRLHTSAAPPRVGLTQALGGKKHSAVALSALELIGFGQHCSSGCSSARRFFGQVHRARSHVAYIALAGFGSYVCFRLVLPLQMLSLLTGPADSSRGALRRPGFGFR